MTAVTVTRCTRASAIEEGRLIDVSEMARKAGFRHPMAMTRAAWDCCIAVPENQQEEQNEHARLWDVLTMYRFSLTAFPDADGDELVFSVFVKNHAFCGVVPIRLCGVWELDDDRETTVITIMFPEEV